MSDLVPSQLADLAVQINERHNAATTAATVALEHARIAGELLWQAKDHLVHGRWLPWLKENFSFTPRTAQNYMKLAKDWPRLQANAKCISHLGVRDALDLLADPREDTEEEAGSEVQVTGVGVVRALEAIEFLKKIRPNDALRKRGFQIVEDWIAHNP